MRLLLTVFALFATSFLFRFHAQQINVLFIGNSYTHMNNMPKIFEQLARSKGKKVYADSIAVSGSTLRQHSERPSTYEKLKSRKWDYVFVQGYSREFAQDSLVIETETIPYARQIIDSLLKYSKCANIYFYMTWGYQEGYAEQEPNNTYEKMQARIRSGYMLIGKRLGYPVAPVGMVWRSLVENHKEIQMYVADKAHPSINGSYTAACTFYTSIFRESPVGAGKPDNVTPENAKIIQKTAETVVLDNLEVYNLDTIQHPVMEIPPVLNFDIAETWTNIVITNKTRNCPDIKWEFGDGSTSRQQNPKHYYEKPGTYTITLNVYKNCQHYILKKRITVSKDDKHATSAPKKTKQPKGGKTR